MNFIQRLCLATLCVGVIILTAQLKSAQRSVPKPDDVTRSDDAAFDDVTSSQGMLMSKSQGDSNARLTETFRVDRIVELPADKEKVRNSWEEVKTIEKNDLMVEIPNHQLDHNHPTAVYNFTDRTKPVLFINSLARFGNSMFQIAAIYGLARQTNHRPMLSHGFRMVAPYFPNLQAAEFGSKPGHGAWAPERFYARYDPNLGKNIEGANGTVYGYLQSWKYFRDYFEETRWLFTFTDRIMTSARQTLHEIRTTIASDVRDDVIFVGVHVRRGDKAGKQRYSYGHRIPNVTYIYKAMDHFRRMYDNVHFVVCSDGRAWCRDNLNGSDVHVMMHVTSKQHDLALLTLCDHIIMTVGTFGWWAGFLGGGDLVYFKHPFAPGTKLYDGFSHEDFFLPHWIAME